MSILIEALTVQNGTDISGIRRLVFFDSLYEQLN